MAQVILFQARPGHPRFHAPLLAAPARRAWMLCRISPGQRIVAPLATGPARTVDQFAFEDEPTAAARAEDHSEQGSGSRTGAVDGLGEGKAVGIVGEAHRLCESVFEIACERLAIEPGGVGVLHAAPAGGDRA